MSDPSLTMLPFPIIRREHSRTLDSGFIWGFPPSKFLFPILIEIGSHPPHVIDFMYFPKDIFPSGNFPNVQYPKRQLPKCAISQVATSQVCPSRSARPQPVLAEAIGTLAHPSRSARTPL